MRLIGLDFGTKWIGISISDSEHTVALPKGKASPTEIKTVLSDLIEDFDIAGFVLGWPLNLKGQITPMTRQVERFELELTKWFRLPVYRQDERLVSKFTDQQLSFANINTKNRRAIKDEMEAAHILQSFLDREIS